MFPTTLSKDTTHSLRGTEVSIHRLGTTIDSTPVQEHSHRH